MNKKSLKILEFDKILDMLRERCVTQSARRLICEQEVVSTAPAARQLLDFTIEADIILNRFNVNPIHGFDEVGEILSNAEKSITLSMGELLKIARLLKSSRLFVQSIKELDCAELKKFNEFAAAVCFDVDFEKEICFKIISEDSINDKASDKLWSIRRRILKINDDIREKLGKFVGGELSKYLQDSIVTLRQGRYVVPVKTEFKNHVQGMVHDMSSSGSTVFIEPVQIVNLNNDLRILILEEEEEIERILAELTQKVSAISEGLRQNVLLICESDIVFSKAILAKETDAVAPKLNDYGVLDIRAGRHPLLDRKKVVPVTIAVGKDCQILTITGPNTGGKTVSLKLAGLFCVMAAFGMFLPCEKDTQIAIFEDIFCDIGDEQSISQNLSTFSSHIKNLSDILDQSIDKCLLLFDELGAGTDPTEGASLALAILQFVLKSKARAIVTTHYGEVKEFSLVTKGVLTSGMQFNALTFEPTYKLEMGVAGSSNAIEIAKRLGLRPEIIESARSFISSEKLEFENVLRRAEQSRFEAEKSLGEIESMKADYAKKLYELEIERQKLETKKDFLQKNAKAEAKRIVADAEIESENIINELKFILNSDIINESDLFYARNLKKKLSNLKNVENDEEEREVHAEKAQDIQEGKSYFIKKFNCNAEVIKLDDNKKRATVRVGSITSTIDIDDLFVKEEEKTEKQKNFSSTPAQGYAPDEIRLIGMNVLEAIEMLDDFLDRAYLANVKTLKIIHGVGTGKLRAGIWDYLKNRPHIESFRKGKYGEGELGVTVVTMEN